jgi:hypothetical protein
VAPAPELTSDNRLCTLSNVAAFWKVWVTSTDSNTSYTKVFVVLLCPDWSCDMSLKIGYDIFIPCSFQCTSRTTAGVILILHVDLLSHCVLKVHGGFLHFAFQRCGILSTKDMQYEISFPTLRLHPTSGLGRSLRS